MSINQRYKKLVSELSHSASAFAREIGVSKSAMSLVINGDAKPRLETLIATCERYPEISVRWLVMGKGQMKEDKNPASNLVNEPQESYSIDAVSILKEQLKIKDAQLTESQKHITQLLRKING